MKRRLFLFGSAGLGAGRLMHAATRRRPRVACILNAYFPNSHADVFMSRLLDGYRLNGKWYAPRVEVASLYVDQFPVNDMAHEQAREHAIPLFPTVAEALRLGGAKLAVDGIAVIGEHGNYPRTPRGNFMYPRKRYFDEITRVMKEDGRIVPLHNDKYLAYEWKDAKEMYDTVRAMKIPFMAGSTLPLTWRRPPLEFDRGTHFRELLAVSNSDLEEHVYHAIEMLQAMAERRAGGETGVARVRYADGEEVWDLARQSAWSRDLLDAALTRRVNPAPVDNHEPPQAFLIEYRDGTLATVINLNSMTRDFLFAARVAGQAEPVSSCFYIQLYLHNHWGFMVRNFEDLVLSRRLPNPVERTLVANGIMLAGLDSKLKGGPWIDTPEIDIRYS
ncbi:MAG: hypothetical protein ACLQU1_03500 [Bryobacteraceae bacterium]